MFNIPH